MLIKRSINQLLQKHLMDNKITAILGPRQTGKTTAIKYLIENLPPEAKILPKNIASFSLDDPELLTNWQIDPKKLIRDIEFKLGKTISGQKERLCVFIDEAQKAPAIFNIIKMLYDEYFDKIKIIITGSSSLSIRQKSAETLAGRIIFFHLSPLSWSEIASEFIIDLSDQPSPIMETIKGDLTWEKMLSSQAPLFKQKEKLDFYWRKIAVCGGLPEIFLEQEKERKEILLRDYLKTYLEKDIRLIAEIGDVDLFTKILTSLIVQDSQLLNLSKLSEQFGINRHTLRKYYSIIKETLLIKGLPAYTAKYRQQAVKSEKIIFFDNGVINYLNKISSFDQLESIGKLGSVLENIIINNLFAAIDNLPMPPNIYYWRDYAGHEIDLVIDNGSNIIPVEITSSKQIINDKKKNLNIFWQKYPKSPFAIIIYSGDLARITIQNKPVYLLPRWMWF